jgi:transcriptional regulator with XRE-family HTH domain
MGTLGQELVAARTGQGKTLRGLAREAGISPALLSLIERDKHVPDKGLVVRLAALLNADGDYLCALVGRITPRAEEHLAQIARDDPEFFRTMVNRLRS